MKIQSTILALAMLIFVALACGGDAESVSTNGGNSSGAAASKDFAIESVTLTDAAGATVQNFKQTDKTQKFAVKLNQMGAARVKGVFKVVNAGGEKNLKILEKELETNSMMNTANFTVSLDNPFPPGDYKMDVFINDKLAKTVNYKVQ